MIEKMKFIFFFLLFQVSAFALEAPIEMGIEQEKEVIQTENFEEAGAIKHKKLLEHAESTDLKDAEEGKVPVLEF